MKTIVIDSRLVLVSDFAWAERVADGVLVHLTLGRQVFERGLTLEQLQARLAGTEAPHSNTTLPQWKPNPGHEPDDIKRADGTYKEGLVRLKDGDYARTHMFWNWDNGTVTHYMILED